MFNYFLNDFNFNSQKNKYMFKIFNFQSETIAFPIMNDVHISESAMSCLHSFLNFLWSRLHLEEISSESMALTSFSVLPEKDLRGTG